MKRSTVVVSVLVGIACFVWAAPVPAEATPNGGVGVGELSTVAVSNTEAGIEIRVRDVSVSTVRVDVIDQETDSMLWTSGRVSKVAVVWPNHGARGGTVRFSVKGWDREDRLVVHQIMSKNLDALSVIDFSLIPPETKLVSTVDPITLDGDIEVIGHATARSFNTESGEILVDPGATEEVALTFGERSVYLVKASWGGGYMEGTRAWFVLTQNDLNSVTGQPTIIEIGMSLGQAHHSETLTLEQDPALGWSQLKLSCSRTNGSDSRLCRWAISRVLFH